MPTFNAGDTLALSLDYNDVIAFDGVGVATVSVADGGRYETRLQGQKLVGPYRQAATVLIACASSGAYAISSDPAANPIARISQQGGAQAISDDAGRVSAIPYILAQSAVPVILAPNGTVAADGTITLGTALPTTYSGAWVRLPAGAVSGGAAGLYWATFSSTTVGAVKSLFADPAQPFTPYVSSGVLVAAVGSGAGYTQTTNANITLVNLTVPGGVMGPNGQLVDTREFSYNTAVGTKSISVNFGGSGVMGSNRTTAGGHDQFTSRIKNRGLQNSNSAYSASEASTSAVVPYANFNINTAVDQSYVLTGNIDTATNYVVIESFLLQVLPS